MRKCYREVPAFDQKIGEKHVLRRHWTDFDTVPMLLSSSLIF